MLSNTEIILIFLDLAKKIAPTPIFEVNNLTRPTQKDICKILRISEVVLSRAKKRDIQGTTCKQKVEAACSNEAIKCIENMYQLPGLFECSSKGAISLLLHNKLNIRQDATQTSCSVEDVIHDNNQVVSSYDLHSVESNFHQDVVGKLKDSCRPIVHIQTPRFVGANFLCSLLHFKLDKNIFRKVIYLTPFESTRSTRSGNTVSFDKAYTELCAYLLCDDRVLPTPEDILREIIRQDALLIFLHGEYLSNYITKGDLFIPLLELMTRPRGGLKKPRAVIVGDRPPSEILDGVEQYSANLHESLVAKNPMPFYLRQIARFSRIRQVDSGSAKLSFRHKRAAYLCLRSNSIEPQTAAAIRANACFSSNLDLFSYYDPTNGYAKLLGNVDPTLCRDITIYRDEVEKYIFTRTPRERRHSIQLLRYASTGIYWLNTSHLKKLSKYDYNSDNLRRHIDALEGVVTVEQESDGEDIYNAKIDVENSRLNASLFVKAVVNDQWNEEDQLDKAQCHYKVAKYLYDMRLYKGMLNTEFPYKPHWHRRSHYFLTETLRHLVRATHEHIDSEDESAIEKLKFTSDFPDFPSYQYKGCNPHQSMTFCYTILFHKGLNGSTAEKRSRSLSNRHGAYHLTAEILQLLSSDIRHMVPKKGIPPEFKQQMYFEYAFSVLDLGQLHDAREHFNIALERSTSKHDKLRAHLNVSLVCTIIGGKAMYEEAQQHINDAANIISIIESDAHTDIKLDKVRTRLRSRGADLMYATGDIKSAIMSYKEMSNNTQGLQYESALNYIDALCDSNDVHNIQIAESEALVRSTHCSASGNNHASIAFGIQNAKLLRIKGNPNGAERLLDVLLMPMTEHGCSERTFIRFLLEAGNICKAQQRFERAYASYLYPCLQRTSNMGFVSQRDIAKKLCIECLDEILIKYRDGSEISDVPSMIKNSLKPRGLVVDEKNYLQENYVPLASYELVDTMKIGNTLLTKEGVESERDRINTHY